MATVLINENSVNVPENWTEQEKTNFIAEREAESVAPVIIEHFDGLKQAVPASYTPEQIQTEKDNYAAVHGV